ncbi:MAG: agmatinase [Lachnospiraceae bacterium]|jgi:agmatinase|nr:agmatinase [Lachnospiraceae bacterium]MCH4070163.1 agmatinase [Lachnospiraceae bacterium]MCH4108485.1 agmatinase [Lachnospiraceae bacterium]MCI1302500.1 agmatinase [Lachnospiraceae bacterium]MCI1331673.1 agmatinase [Lachnospiraceae bacterium]
MMKPNVETFIGCDSSFEDADVVLFGAPFDSTTSYRPGARFGPPSIRHESYGLETYSPYQDRDLTDIRVFDAGDLELCFGNSRKALGDIEAATDEILSAGKLPVMTGGEHLVTLGAFKAALHKFPDIQIIHFDAHCDLRDEYLGEPYSHACVLRRCHDLIGDGRIHQFCIRSGDRTEFAFAAAGHTDLHPFGFEGLEETVRELAESRTPVYLTIDLDCLDPSVFPGTGTPEAGGVTFPALLHAVRVCAAARVVAADVNELAPMLDASGVSTATACKVVRELLLALAPEK